MAKVITDEKKIDEILTRGVHEIITKKELKEKLMSGKQLHLKLGTDVTGPLLHLGHSVVHRKMRDFQDLGHRVTLIIGDFTTLVGDHSDKVDMRDEVSSEQIKRNEETYKEQFFKTVRENLCEVRYNSEWLKPLNFNDLIHLAKQFTIAQMLDREAFLKRYQSKKPIGLDEFLYPLMQGFDSIALQSDVEFGGTDQTFNILAGRKLMEVYGLTPQNAFIMKLLTGSDGRAMGKSLLNFIPISDPAEDMYGKIMGIVDAIIFEYFELVTRVPMEEIHAMQEEVKKGKNPMGFKKRLALEITTFYHGEEEAKKAAEIFTSGVQKGEAVEEFVTKTEIKGEMSILEFIRKVKGKEISSGEIKRLVQQGGVEVNGKKVDDFTTLVEFNSGDVIKVRKRDFIKIV